MTARDKKALSDYTRHLADEMGLRDWAFELHFTDKPLYPDEEGQHVNDSSNRASIAEVDPGACNRHANIRFDPELRKLTREYVRNVVCHELVHLHLHEMRELVRTGIRPHLGDQAYEILCFAFDTRWEYAVDAIAVEWAKKLPLIDWKAGAKKEKVRDPRE